MSNLIISGKPNERQQAFFDSRSLYTAYGGARGGGKSWALRRKLTALCLRYPSIRCLLVRRTFPELKANHVEQFLREYPSLWNYRDSEKKLYCRGGGSITLGYCAAERDVLRYQGQEYDIIAIDEATQLSENQFNTFCACLRGTEDLPRRIYLTCNPGGIGHAWVKRLFIDRRYHPTERAEDYCFIPASVYDNAPLLLSSHTYLRQLEGLPPRLREAWLYGNWDVFEGQFFSDFDRDVHIVKPTAIPINMNVFVAADYGFDMLAALLCGVDGEGNLWVVDERSIQGLTLSAAADVIADLSPLGALYTVASPDLWNRRQDSGLSGVEIMSRNPRLPPLRPADDRRIAGWRALHEYLVGSPSLRISERCTYLIECMTSLLCDISHPEDAASSPHRLTHAPEALRYAVMSRAAPPSSPSDFTFHTRHSIYDM